MLGRLPQTLDVRGTPYDIRSDFRSILLIIAAFNDDELTDAEKLYVCLKQIYKDFERIPHDAYAEAYERAVWFINCGEDANKEGRKNPKTVSWTKDEGLIFPAINRAAGQEVRLAKYMHWWTFMGFFQNIDKESTYGYILTLRPTRAKGKKFEKWESEFWNNNREMCDLNLTASSGHDAESTLAAIYEQLKKG